MKQKILTIIMVTIIIISLFGCQYNTIQNPDIETKKVEVQSSLNYVNFNLEIPRDCNVFEENKNSITCEISSKEHSDLPFEMSPYILSITNYLMPDFIIIDSEYKKSYEDLFDGKYEGIEKTINDNIEYINIGAVIDNYPDVDFENTEKIITHFNNLIDNVSTPNLESPEDWEEKEWASDFTYTEYHSKSEKIIAVEYTFIFLDKTYRAINCYRDDNYSVCGVYDDKTEISSGEIALWIADNMEITEHYKIKNGILQEEGIYY